MSWQHEEGSGRTRVVVYSDDDRQGMLTLRWRQDGNWKRKTLGRSIDENGRGKITRECEEFAVAAAQQKSLELAGVLPSAAPLSTALLTIAEAEALIIDGETGKYPHRSPFRDELVRAIRLAAVVWGADTPWTAIEESHYTMLLRRRLEALLTNKRKGVRTTEITVSRIITTVRWLRSKKHIPREAAPWPEDWKAEIAQHWKGHTGSVRDPQSDRPRHTLEEAQAILKASGFDPRFELLMWLGMDLRLGQVARARRNDLALTDGDVLAAGDYGRFTVFGAGKKGGTVVALTAGQRAVVDRMLASYLKDLEAQYLRGDIKDYLLFPAGYVTGRVALSRGKESTLALAKHVDLTKSVSGSWIRKNFQVAEARAKVEHERGRGAYGLRRQGTDVGVEAQLSPSGLQALGGWSDSKMPMTIYAERTNKAGQLEARAVRAKLRGEE